ncbi:hypothetical protein [Methylacidiphilum kamchatkense]|uniref:hypothetical protein n=1 Tax=Methylacidiphilum kamchatkense TaxID=431057 RepID=UPI002285B9BE|nr:hypothetical protein [Methylacidiphilum kamchatkense]
MNSTLSGISIAMISLGCSKNLVDSEVMLGKLLDAGASLTASPHRADILLINTCGFILPAKKEIYRDHSSRYPSKRDRSNKTENCGDRLPFPAVRKGTVFFAS